LTSADVVGIVLDRAFWRGILSLMHVLVAVRLYAYSKHIRDVLANQESTTKQLLAAQRRVWLAIAYWVAVVAVWKAAMFVVFGFLFRNWGW
jgi:magnesium-transporting ATPase (P-type)